MTTPVCVDVIAVLPESWGLCRTCEAFLSQADLSRSSERSDLETYPLDWQEQFRQLSGLIETISREFGNQVDLHIYDPRSPEGIAKSLRHRIRRYPAFVIAGRTRLNSLDWESVRQAIQLAQAQT